MAFYLLHNYMDFIQKGDGFYFKILKNIVELNQTGMGEPLIIYQE